MSVLDWHHNFLFSETVEIFLINSCGCVVVWLSVLFLLRVTLFSSKMENFWESHEQISVYFLLVFFQFFVSDLNRLFFPRTSPICLNLSPLHICLPSWPVSHWKGAVDKAPLCIFQFLFMFSSDFKAHTHIYTYSCIFGFVVRCREVWLLYLFIGLHDFAIVVIHFIIFNAFFVLFFDVNFAVLYHFLIIFIITICIVYIFTSLKKLIWVNFSGPLL